MSNCSICKQPIAPGDDCGGDCTSCMAEAGDLECIVTMYERLKRQQRQQLAVWCGPMPESNGRQNWTVMLYRKGGDIFREGSIQIERSEYPDRVRYEADRMRYLIGELEDEPDIMKYDANLHSGYAEPVTPSALSDHPDLLDELSKRLPSKLMDRVNDALAATGKQQVGEVQGDVLASLTREYRPSMPEAILREWAADIVAALAVRQTPTVSITNGEVIGTVSDEQVHVVLMDALHRVAERNGYPEWAHFGPPVQRPAQGIPGNVLTHRNAWRKALVAARDAAEVSPPDVDDRAYWEHEIQAFDRTFDKLGELVCQNDNKEKDA